VSNDERQAEVIRNWWSKSQQSLESAKREIQAGSYSFAINRLYYAAFYGVTAVLLDRELAFTRHSGVRAAFQREVIKPGLLRTEWGKLYDQLFEDRQEADYIPLTSFDEEYVKSQLDRTVRFLEELRTLVSVLPKE